MGIHRHSAERVYQVIRRCLARECELHSPLGGEVECDESYFGGRRKPVLTELNPKYLIVETGPLLYLAHLLARLSLVDGRVTPSCLTGLGSSSGRSNGSLISTSTHTLAASA
jgi:hypothetical protein